MKFQWESIYETGIERIDEQHQRFFKLVRELSDANRMDLPTDISNIFDQLLDYTQYHFTDEEELLIKYNYPYLESHKQEHIRFAQKVKEWRKEFENNKQIFLHSEVLSFLKMWLMEHIQGTDMDYVPHLKKEMEK